MFRVRTIIASLVCGVVATSLLVSMTSQAWAGWLINGTSLTGTAALATKQAVAERFKLKAIGVTVECAGGSLSGTGMEVGSPNTLSAASITFSECSASEPCSLATKAITSVPIAAEMQETGFPEDVATLAPKTKTILATIKFNGEVCALLGVQPVKGSMFVGFPAGQEERTLQEVRAEIPEVGELTLGSSGVVFTGAALLELSSKQTIGFGGGKFPTVRITWAAGNQEPALSKRCLFKKTNDTCEVKVEVITAPNAPLEAVQLALFQNAEKKFEEVAPEKNQCKVGALIGAGGKPTNFCFVKLKYTGPNEPTEENKYTGRYFVKAKEKGGGLEETAKQMMFVGAP